MSKLQSKALVELLESKAAVTTSQDRVDIAATVIKMQCAIQSDLDVISTSLMWQVDQGSKKARRQNQIFVPIANYFREGFWGDVSCTSTASSAKHMMLLQCAVRLGLRLPSEPTFE